MSGEADAARAARLRPHDHVIFTDLDGREGVLVDLNTKQYYQLNETASLVWRGLTKGSPVETIVAELMSAYDVTREHATSSVNTIIGHFTACHLLSDTRVDS
jgi:hypothetical protein